VENEREVEEEKGRMQRCPSILTARGEDLILSPNMLLRAGRVPKTHDPNLTNSWMMPGSDILTQSCRRSRRLVEI